MFNDQLMQIILYSIHLYHIKNTAGVSLRIEMTGAVYLFHYIGTCIYDRSTHEIHEHLLLFKQVCLRLLHPCLLRKIQRVSHVF